MALHEQGQPKEAHTALAKASRIITQLNDDPSTKGHHDLLIAEVLFREADAKINGKNDSSDDPSTASEKPSATK